MLGAIRKSSLFKRSLGLVGALLAIELCFIGFLLYELRQEEACADKLRRSKSVVAKSERLLEFALTNAHTFNEEFFRNSPMDSGSMSFQTEEMQREVPQLLAGLEEDLKSEPERLQKVHRVRDQYLVLMTRVSEMRAKIQQLQTLPFPLMMQQFQQIKDSARTLRGAFTEGIYSTFAICGPDRKIEQDNAQLQETYRARMWSVFWLFAAFNILAAIAAAVAFTRGITKRIEILVDNTNRLAKQSQLHPAMTGKDEIAYLDQQFHAMADSLKAAQEAEQRAQQFKQEVLLMVSHDLRSPLQTVVSFFSLMDAGVVQIGPENGRRLAEGCRVASSRMLTLIGDLLDIEKIKSDSLALEPQEVSVDEMLAETQQSLQVWAASSDVHIVCIPPTGIRLIADRKRVLQVLANLTSNAVKFSPRGGQIRLGAQTKADFVEFYVQDQGRGIPKDKQGMIFERFGQVDVTDTTDKGGSGLGLAICKALVELHGGSIGVTSQEGAGSTFWFRLPAAGVSVRDLRIDSGLLSR